MAGLLGATVAFAQTTDTAAPVENNGDIDRLEALLADIETLSADVEQLIVEKDGGVLETSQIRMRLKRPDGFYWETTEPFPELIVTDGETLWNYQPDLEQVVIENWDDVAEELAARLLSGKIASLNEDYRIIMNREVDEFLLTPRASESPYSAINLTFVNANLDTIYLRGKNGQQTVWRFYSLIKNSELAPDLFSFTPPEGIEVIVNTYP